MKKVLLRLFSVSVFILPFLLSAQTRLPTFFGDHMVLQRNENVVIWGWDNPGQTITIQSGWGQRATAKTNEEGKWEAVLITPSAGGPHELTIRGSEEITLRDVMSGEVWICSGQSNMVMPFSGYRNQPVLGAGDAIVRANQSGIRMYTAEREASVFQLDDLKGQWEVSSTKNLPHFSAVAYFFGKMLEEVLEVPVGLIVTAWGGSSIETWMNEPALKKAGITELPDELPEKNPHHVPTLLYNAMIYPLAPFTAKGFLWYQGENNVAQADKYQRLFTEMIRQWRADFKNPDMPFYFTEIAPFNYGANNSAFLREAQLETMLSVPNTGMAGTIDLGDCTNIHPGDKYNVGRRLALWALSQTYGLEGFKYSGPIYKEMEKTEDHKITLSFDHADGGFYTFSQEPMTGFEIAGADGDFQPAQARISGNGEITVWSDQIRDPEAVRYGFSNCPEVNLYNMEELPAPSFRTKK